MNAIYRHLPSKSVVEQKLTQTGTLQTRCLQEMKFGLGGSKQLYINGIEWPSVRSKHSKFQSSSNNK